MSSDHRHRIEKYLDTVLANQTARKALPPQAAEPGGGAQPPQRRGWGHHALWAPNSDTPVDRNKAYCFHELVLNLPAPLDIQWPKCFQLQGGQSPPDLLTRGCAPGPRWGLCPQTPVIGSCSALAMVPSQPLTPSAAYDCHRHLTTGVSARRSILTKHTVFTNWC